MKAKDCKNIYEYSPQIEILKELFGSDTVSPILNRLNDIYVKTEEKWRENLKRLKGFPVKYLLVAEAPPWTEQGNEVRYFYNKLEGPWCERIWHTFFPKDNKLTDEERLKKLTEKGFLLIDTLPFAMEYTSAIRKKEQYQTLINACCLPFLMKKLNDQKILWGDDVKLAFAFKLNAKAVIKALLSVIEALPKELKEIDLSEERIATDGSGYTSSSKLRDLFGLE